MAEVSPTAVLHEYLLGFPNCAVRVESHNVRMRQRLVNGHLIRPSFVTRHLLHHHGPFGLPGYQQPHPEEQNVREGETAAVEGEEDAG